MIRIPKEVTSILITPPGHGNRRFQCEVTFYYANRRFECIGSAGDVLPAVDKALVKVHDHLACAKTLYGPDDDDEEETLASLGFFTKPGDRLEGFGTPVTHEEAKALITKWQAEAALDDDDDDDQADDDDPPCQPLLSAISRLDPAEKLDADDEERRIHQLEHPDWPLPNMYVTTSQEFDEGYGEDVILPREEDELLDDGYGPDGITRDPMGP